MRSKNQYENVEIFIIQCPTPTMAEYFLKNKNAYFHVIQIHLIKSKPAIKENPIKSWKWNTTKTRNAVSQRISGGMNELCFATEYAQAFKMLIV